MSAGEYDLTIEQGASFYKMFTLKTTTSATNPTLIYFDLTGYTAEAQIREQFSSDIPLARFNVGFMPSGSSTGSISSSGSIVLSLTPGQTLVLPGGLTGVWDLLLFQGTNVTKILEGRAFISPLVTRD